MTFGTPRSSTPGISLTRAIDRSVLGEWLGDDDQTINEMLTIFRDSACAEHARMRESLADRDLPAFSKAAHRLRGCALSMGARALGEIASELETASLASDDAACTRDMVALETQMSLMVAEVPTGHEAPPPAA